MSSPVHDGAPPARRLLAVAALHTALAAAYTWPLALHLADRVPHDGYDPLLNAFLLWWNAHRLPLTHAWWNAPFFFPLGGTIALSETLLGLSVLATPLQLAGASPLLAHNLLYLLSFPLCGLAMHLLARELGAREGTALVAGLAFAFTPYRAAHLAHLQLLCAFWIPLVFLGLHRFLRTGRRRDLVLAAAAWMLQALTNGYLFLFLAVVVAGWLAWFVVAARRWRALATVAVAWAAASLLPVLVFVQYRPWHARHGFARNLAEIESMSADLLGFVTPPRGLVGWSLDTAVSPESWVFPGLALPLVLALSFVAWRRSDPERLLAGWLPLALSAVAAAAATVAALTSWLGPWRFGVFGLSVSAKVLHKPLAVALYALAGALAASPALRRACRRGSVPVFYGLAAVGCAILALGPTPRVAGALFWDRAPYNVLLRLPGFAALRAPARFTMLAVFCLACAAAVGLSRLTARSRFRQVCVALAAAAVLWDGWIRPLRLADAPFTFSVPGGTPGNAVVLEVPLGGVRDTHAMYRMSGHGLPVVNGYSGFDPPHFIALRQGIERGEDGVLDVLQRRAPVLVLLDPGARRAGLLRDAVRANGGTSLGEGPAGRETYLLPALPPAPPPPTGTRIEHVRVDGRSSRVLCDLGRVEPVGSVTMLFGRGVTRLPPRIVVEAAEVVPRWTVVWEGRICGLAVEGALRDPRRVPVSVSFPAIRARHVRLRLFDSLMVEDVLLFRPAAPGEVAPEVEKDEGRTTRPE